MEISFAKVISISKSFPILDTKRLKNYNYSNNFISEQRRSFD